MNNSAEPTIDQEYRPQLVRFAYSYLKNATEAEDAAQDVLLKALAAGSRPDEVRPWLYRIARNHCLNILRQRHVRSEVRMPSRAPFAESGMGHLTRLVASEDAHRLRERVEALSEEHREVLELRYGEDLSRVEIAQVLDIAPSLVKSRLFEAVKKLRASVG